MDSARFLNDSVVKLDFYNLFYKSFASTFVASVHRPMVQSQEVQRSIDHSKLLFHKKCTSTTILKAVLPTKLK